MAERPKVIPIENMRQRRLREFCPHRALEFDERGRVIECVACRASLDPFDVIARLSTDMTCLDLAKDERKRIAEEIEGLKTRRASLKAGLRSAAQHDPIVAELTKLKSEIASRLRAHPDEAVARLRASLRHTLECLVNETIERIEAANAAPPPKETA
jgi:hypothetical protein